MLTYVTPACDFEPRELYQSVLLVGDDSSESVDSEDAEHLKVGVVPSHVTIM